MSRPVDPTGAHRSDTYSFPEIEFHGFVGPGYKNRIIPGSALCEIEYLKNRILSDIKFQWVNA